MTSFRCLKIDDLFKIVLVPEDIDKDIDIDDYEDRGWRRIFGRWWKEKNMSVRCTNGWWSLCAKLIIIKMFGKASKSCEWDCRISNGYAYTAEIIVGRIFYGLRLCQRFLGDKHFYFEKDFSLHVHWRYDCTVRFHLPVSCYDMR
jgi:hypothetical protein